MNVPKMTNSGKAWSVVLLVLVWATLAVLGMGLVLTLSYAPVAGNEMATLTIGIATVGVSGIAITLHFVRRDHRQQVEESQLKMRQLEVELVEARVAAEETKSPTASP